MSISWRQDGLILFDFPHRRHGSGDEPGDIGHVAGHDNRVGRLCQVAELHNVLLRQPHVERFDSTVILDRGGYLILSATNRAIRRSHSRVSLLVSYPDNVTW